VSSNSDLLNPTQTIRAVLCYIRNENQFLLLLKSSGRFGGGFWNAPGGKIKDGEDPVIAAKREVLEETGLTVEDLEKMGFLEFLFGAGKQKPDWTAEVFITTKFSGSIHESEEGKLQWIPKENLPLGQMWQDDRYWLPLLVEGKKFRGSFQFSSDSKDLLSYNVEEGRF
jgi:8-oxo-dGTP diphosphatase